MSGKRKREFPARSLSWGESPRDITMPPTGMLYGMPQRMDQSSISQPTYEFNITERSVQLLRIMANRLLWNDRFLFSAGELALESLGAPGLNQDWMLTLRIRDQNSGMVTEITNMLLSMNFEAVSTSPIFSDGLIGTLCLWRSKDRLHRW